MKLTIKTKLLIAFIVSTLTLVSCANKKDKDDQKVDEGNQAKKEMQNSPKNEKDYFAAIDLNEDGNVTKEEFVNHAKEEYSQRDKNEDGKVDEKECKMFKEFNTDGDDILTQEEFAKGHEMMFAKIDTDENASISKEEMMGFMKEMKMKHAPKESKCGEGKCGEGKCGDGK